MERLGLSYETSEDSVKLNAGKELFISIWERTIQMKCAYLNDKNLYVSGKLPIGAKQLRIRVVIKGELQGK